MIDFRYHIVSLVAVFLALATGILLGAGPLQEPIQGQLEGRAEALRDDQQQLREANGELQARVQMGDAFTSEVAAALVGTQLSGRRVVLVTLPGVDDRLREATEASLASAGAVVSGRVGIEPDLFDPDRLAEASEVIDALAEPTVPAPELRVAAALAGSIVTTAVATLGPASAELAPATPAADPATAVPAASPQPVTPAGEPDEQAAAILTGLTELGVINVDGEPAARATVAVVLAPGVPQEDATSATTPPPEQRDTVLLPLMSQLASAGDGVVLAGGTRSVAGGGFVAAVREDGSLDGAVSTVDVAETPQGQVAMLLAIIEQERGGAGDYGAASGVERVLPTLDPALAPTP